MVPPCSAGLFRPEHHPHAWQPAPPRHPCALVGMAAAGSWQQVQAMMQAWVSMRVVCCCAVVQTAVALLHKLPACVVDG
jgi:hypothetical protein